MLFNESFFARYWSEPLGWSVIPIGSHTKTPLVKWTKYQTQRAHRDEISDWCRRNTNAGIAVVTGPLSGVFVIDADNIEDLPEADKKKAQDFISRLPRTATSITTSGKHYFLKWPATREVSTKVRFMPGLDSRGRGGYALVAPSVHPSGQVYTWEIPPEEGIAECPDFLLDTIEQSRSAILEGYYDPKLKKSQWKSALHNINEGSRNDSAAKVIGAMLSKIPEDLWTLQWEAVKAWNSKECTPPLPIEELKTTFESIANAETKKRNLPVDFEDEEDGGTWQELWDKDIPPTGYAISDFLTDGLTLLIGKPKDGKSYLTIQMAVAVASGGLLFPNSLSSISSGVARHTNKGEVLHISLEDGEVILKDRQCKMLKERPKNDWFYTYKTKWPLMFEGGNARLLKWLENHPNTRLVIIDTLVKYVGGAEPKGNAYRGDYLTLLALQEVAAKFKVPILATYHAGKTHKLKGTDPYEAIAGTGGLLGAPDNLMSFIRHPVEDTAILHVKGRKINEPYELNLRLEKELYKWVIAPDKKGKN